MHLETSSNLYGVTTNPYNRRLTAGGSSGGEGALLALRGSCLGIGTDIGEHASGMARWQCTELRAGGSIRNPSGNNGVYGLRPTGLRLPLLGSWAPNLGMEYVSASPGPMSTSLGGLELFMKTLLAAKPWLTDPSLVAIPWNADVRHPREAEGRINLRIGVMWNDQVVRVHPPVTRALREVVEKLDKVEGVEIVEFKPHKHDLAWKLTVRLDLLLLLGLRVHSSDSRIGQLILP